MGTEHNNINANDRYKGYTSFHDKCILEYRYAFPDTFIAVFCNAVDKRQGPWASCYKTNYLYVGYISCLCQISQK